MLKTTRYTIMSPLFVNRVRVWMTTSTKYYAATPAEVRTWIKVVAETPWTDLEIPDADFDIAAMHSAIDERRRERQMSWKVVASEIGGRGIVQPGRT